MGLDIYAGTVTRYYARSWKTVTQQMAEQLGYGYQVFRQNENPDDTETDISVIQQDASTWCCEISQQLNDAYDLSCEPWEENNEKDYYTDKPDWLAFECLLLFAACLIYGENFPETVKKGEDLFQHELVKRAMSDSDLRNWSLFSDAEWWLPYNDYFVVKGRVPNGAQVVLSTTASLLAELQGINSRTWQADKQTILSWTEKEGYPSDGHVKDGKYTSTGEHTEYNAESLAKFAYAILFKAVLFSQENRVPIILDY